MAEGERRTTTGGLVVEEVYGPEHAPEPDALGAPGSFPYTRGVYPTMYRGRVWTMRQYAGFGTAQETNERYRYLLEHGQTGLSVAFDLPTQMGYDSDAPMAAGEVGRVGVAIDSLEDMRTLFEGIPLDRVSVSMTINATAAILLALYVALGDERGVARDALAGTIQNDILKEYIARGTYIYPVEPSLRLVTDTFAFCAQGVPRWNTISISGYHIREAGSTAAQELAFTFANGLEYVERAVAAGLAVEDFAAETQGGTDGAAEAEVDLGLGGFPGVLAVEPALHYLLAGPGVIGLVLQAVRENVRTNMAASEMMRFALFGPRLSRERIHMVMLPGAFSGEAYASSGSASSAGATRGRSSSRRAACRAARLAGQSSCNT